LSVGESAIWSLSNEKVWLPLSTSTPNNGTDSSDSSTSLETSLAELTERTSPHLTLAATVSTALKSTNPPSPPVLPLSLYVVTAANELLSASLTVRRNPKVLRRVSRILIKEGLHFANLFYIFE